jgi:hypothetical protein
VETAVRAVVGPVTVMAAVAVVLTLAVGPPAGSRLVAVPLAGRLAV